MIEYDLKCPHCGFEGEYCDFPDFYAGGMDEKYAEQYKMVNEIFEIGLNLVTCGMCGDVVIHRI